MREESDGTISNTINTPATMLPRKNPMRAREKKSFPAHLYMKYVRRYIHKNNPITAGNNIPINDIMEITMNVYPFGLVFGK